MFKGFYTAATGMIAQQRKTEMLSNNIANANTTGYKADQSTIRSFPTMLLSSIDQSSSASIKNGFDNTSSSEVGGISAGVYMQETLPNFAQGSIIETGINTDVALLDGDFPINEETGAAGSIFYKVQTEDGGQAYTRNGNFTLDGEGFLTTAQGNYVLDANDEPMQFTNDQFTISANGEIMVDGQQVNELGVAYSDNPNTLSKRENGLFFTTDGQVLPNAVEVEGVTYTMQQGFTEGSNVDASQAMTEMMAAYRVFEANQKILTAYDKSMEKAVNEIGRV